MKKKIVCYNCEDMRAGTVIMLDDEGKCIKCKKQFTIKPKQPSQPFCICSHGHLQGDIHDCIFCDANGVPTESTKSSKTLHNIEPKREQECHSPLISCNGICKDGKYNCCGEITNKPIEDDGCICHSEKNWFGPVVFCIHCKPVVSRLEQSSNKEPEYCKDCGTEIAPTREKCPVCYKPGNKYVENVPKAVTDVCRIPDCEECKKTENTPLPWEEEFREMFEIPRNRLFTSSEQILVKEHTRRLEQAIVFISKLLAVEVDKARVEAYEKFDKKIWEVIDRYIKHFEDGIYVFKDERDIFNADNIKNDLKNITFRLKEEKK